MRQSKMGLRGQGIGYHGFNKSPTWYPAKMLCIVLWMGYLFSYWPTEYDEGIDVFKNEHVKSNLLYQFRAMC